MEKLIINSSICGAAMMKENNPAIPYTIEELAREAKSAYDAGASVIHLHVRDDEGRPVQDRQRFDDAIKAIAKACPGVIVQPSTAGLSGMTDEERLDVLNITPTPEFSSVTCGTSNMVGDSVFINRESTIINFANFMREMKITPEIEVFDKSMIDVAKKHIKNGLFEKPYNFNLILGIQLSATTKDLVFLVDALPEGSNWTATGVGRGAFDIATVAIVMGGHVRIGFEDTQYLKKGVKAKSNGELVKKVADIAKILNREIATPDEAREILGIG